MEADVNTDQYNPLHPVQRQSPQPFLSVSSPLPTEMNTAATITKINDSELASGITGTSASWHEEFASSSWVWVGGVDKKLTEGDIIAVMSEYGEIEDIHAPRDDVTGERKGFAFVKYEDFRASLLAVDNLTGVKVLGRTLVVDHSKEFRKPKQNDDDEGDSGPYGPSGGRGGYTKNVGVDLFARGDGDGLGTKRHGDKDEDDVGDRFGGAGYELVPDDWEEDDEKQTGDRKKKKAKKEKDKKKKHDKKSKRKNEKKEKKMKKRSRDRSESGSTSLSNQKDRKKRKRRDSD